MEVGVTKTVEIDLRRYRGKWNTKEEFELYQAVRKAFDRMKYARRTSCPFPTPTSAASKIESSDKKSTGSDWASRWNADVRLWSKYKYPVPEGRSNLKSPTSYSMVEAAVAEFIENEYKATLTPTHAADEGKIKVMEKILDCVYNTSDEKQLDADTYKRMAIFGTAIVHTCWVSSKRELEVILSQKEIDKKLENPDQETEDTLMKNGKPLTEKRTYTKEDIVQIPVSIYEFYVDPAARVLIGPAYEAMDCIWRQIPSLEQFRAEFKNTNDPYIIKKNVDRVTSAKDAAQMYVDTKAFFDPPKDVMYGEAVELLRYYNKITDKYIIIANDIIIRNGPLPYNHKELPFQVYKFVDFPDQFYGVSIPTLLEDTQAESETLRNMKLDQLKININPPIFINSDVYSDVDKGWQRVEPGLKIEVGGSTGPENIRWFEPPNYSPDYSQMQSELEGEAIKTVGMNSLLSALPKQGEAVRNNMMAMETSIKTIKKSIRNWAIGKKEAIRQKISLITQYYPTSRIEEYKDGVKYLMPKSIRMQDEVITNEEGNYNVEKSEGLSYFSVEEDAVTMAGNINVEIDVDNVVPVSRAARMQRSEMALAQLTPLLMNPMALKAPGVLELVVDYIKTHGIPDVAEQIQTPGDESEVSRAQQQESQIIDAGEELPGIPGESNSHKMQHTMTIMGIVTSLNNDQELTDVDRLLRQEQFRMLSEHLRQDDMPKVGAQMGPTDPMQSGAMPGMPPNPTMGEMTPPSPIAMGEVGAEQGFPNMPIPQG